VGAGKAGIHDLNCNYAIASSGEISNMEPSSPPSKMQKTRLSKIYPIGIAAYFSLLGIACCQDRLWTNTEGRQITGRAVSKDKSSVVIRMQNGKRVSIDLRTLGHQDLDWLNKWTPPKITVSASMEGVGYQGQKRIEKRRFKFSSSAGCNFVIFEDELPDVIVALKNLIELAQKPASDVNSYEQILHRGKAIGVPGKSGVVIFRINKGKPYCSGWITGSYNSHVSLENVFPLFDFIETFSVRDWERKEEEIKRRFEK
jgi:hypothetical protein